MTGPYDSIIGTEKQAALSRFRTGLPTRFEPATGDPKLHAVLITADEATGRATGIRRISVTADALFEMKRAAHAEAE
jgi:calcineurin-like phosphoesterase